MRCEKSIGSKRNGKPKTYGNRSSIFKQPATYTLDEPVNEADLFSTLARLEKKLDVLADLVRCNPTRQEYVKGYKAAAEFSGFTVNQLRRFVAIGAIGRGAETETGGKIAFSIAELRALRKRNWIKAKV
jgi:hypothetical protein